MSAFDGTWHLYREKTESKYLSILRLRQDSGTSDNLGKGYHLIWRSEPIEQDPGTWFDLVGAEFMAFAGFFCKNVRNGEN